MNIFATTDDPVACARALDDKRVGKMLMESNQMMSLALKHWYDIDEDVHCGKELLTKGHAHLNHPCSIWARTNTANFEWLYQHAWALAHEWEHRFDTVHGSSMRLPYILKFRLELMTDVPPPRTPFANCAANEGKGISCKHIPDVHMAYREYLRERWATDTREPVWTNRGEPAWRPGE